MCWPRSSPSRRRRSGCRPPRRWGPAGGTSWALPTPCCAPSRCGPPSWGRPCQQMRRHRILSTLVCGGPHGFSLGPVDPEVFAQSISVFFPRFCYMNSSSFFQLVTSPWLKRAGECEYFCVFACVPCKVCVCTSVSVSVNFCVPPTHVQFMHFLVYAFVDIKR